MKYIKVIFVLVMTTYLLGCASAAKMEGMVFQGNQKEYASELSESMVLGPVSGGKTTYPFWTSQIGSEAFANAVKQSLKSQGLYSDTGKYRLEARILRVEQPFFGLDFEVATYVQYILTNAKTGAVIFDEKVFAQYTASVSDTFFGVKRLRLANEGSAQKNIEEFLEKLSKLRIEPNQVTLVR